eukprot:Blabericola_migrator_1__7906@NODE_4047_length_1358_cov_51_080558_g2496_i0_p1_GENE_NODE_4047_length_1358_cov_51_080558_g2496_i0NODE_4047_length_1358_cov_51_080558_g2496_i0_p1_ORF_typecomplete_len150_score14_61DUF5583/PF17821_1/0_38DUF5583/PF17821_1/1_5e02_NODE_4047_length_1358_cov_51_080558_g2496_i07131162
MPLWSEPMLLIKCLNKEKTVFQAQSLWHRDLIRQVTAHMCKKIPTVLLPEMQKYHDLEKAHDSTVHRAPSSTQPSPDPVQYSPTLPLVPRSTDLPSSTAPKQQPLEELANCDDDATLWTYDDPLPQARKRKRIFCVRLRTRPSSEEGRG